jgi:chromosome segregation ATPase
VQRTLAHTERDLQLAEEEQASIEQGIMERTRDTQDEKLALLEQARGLEADIEELMRQVRALQAQLAGVNEQLAAAEAKINVTRQSYERPLRRIAEKRDRIQQGTQQASVTACHCKASLHVIACSALACSCSQNETRRSRKW